MGGFLPKYLGSPREAMMMRLIRIYGKEIASLFIACFLLGAFVMLFPPDIHSRIRAIRRLQPGAYHPPADLPEKIRSRMNARLEEPMSHGESSSGRRENAEPPLEGMPPEFNVESYFRHFNRLKMDDGYSLEYAYYIDNGRGFPLLYARSHKSPRLLDQYDFEERFGEIRERKKVVNAYLEHIRTDGSREGFIQLAALLIIGDQFHLYWHAHYNDTMILSRLPAWVTFSGDEVAVSLFTFTAWGGVKLYTIRVKREFPHTIISEDALRLIPYSCGIRF